MIMKISLAFIILIGFISCQKHADTQAEGEKIMKLIRDRSKAGESGNIEGVVKYWTDDAILMIPKQQPVKGKTSLINMFKLSMQNQGLKINWEPESVIVSDGGDMAYVIGKSRAIINDSAGHPDSEVHQSLTIWRKGSDGNWLNAVEIWTQVPSNQ